MMIKMVLVGAAVAAVAATVLFSSELAEMFPESSEALAGAIDRFVDLADSTVERLDDTVDANISKINAKVSQLAGNTSEFVSNKTKQLEQAVPTQIFADVQEP